MTHRFSLEGQVAIVTGASRGLGYEMARAIGESGAKVYLTARGVERLEAVVARLRDEGIDAVALPFDLADSQACLAAVEEVTTADGRLDILVNNAGINAWEPLHEATVETWDRVFRTNVNATYLLCREAARHMRKAGYGRIINIGSALAVVGRENVTAYTASKHGVAGMTRALAAELGPDGVTVNMMAPGYFTTEINEPILAKPGYERGVSNRIPLNRWGSLKRPAASSPSWPRALRGT